MNQYDRVRYAAQQMRLQHGPEHVRHRFWHSLSRLLDNIADFNELNDNLGIPRDVQAVVESYLEANEHIEYK